MPSYKIAGIDVKFPFEPYEIQKNYMSKVIECLKLKSNAVLESPTGTGKTLSLLCASLAWLESKKAQIQLAGQTPLFGEEGDNFIQSLEGQLSETVGDLTTGRVFIKLPRIIYASRTHTQLTQAMQELKRTSYNYMKACVIGSREQMCIHPEVRQEANSSAKVHLCRMKVQSRNCHLYNRVDQKKADPAIHKNNVMDIEDLVKAGEALKFCPYYMAKELTKSADIIFMPYNYLLDPKMRKGLGVGVSNNIVILDEAHNVEKMCEESASLQIKSTDVTLCIDEITAVMKVVSDGVIGFEESEAIKDFTPEDLCALKQIFLDFERELDNIPLGKQAEGTTFEGNYIFELLAKAGITDANYNNVLHLIQNLVEFLSIKTEGPFQRKGAGLQLFEDLLTIVFSDTSLDFKAKIKKCFKVHLTVEEVKKRSNDVWFSKANTKTGFIRVLSYWCFSPGFGMNMLVGQGIHSIILTSGTLAPLNPLITELELNVSVRLENPHVVKGNQICVKIVPKGPDNEPLNCNFHNRSNEKYLRSLGLTILNITRMIPNGLLIFFPSYPIMMNCQTFWQQSGIWGDINDLKTIYVEPKDKTSFANAMTEYYKKIGDPSFNGAIFMGVCRGKISEGLDFADVNGRAVIIIGLPFPPFKDPRVILKKRYLTTCNSINKEYVTGEKWYSLEACRAVNQAIGRVIRHRADYGAIILLDERFANSQIQAQLSLWLREHIKVAKNFGEIVRDLRLFFKNAQEALPVIPKNPDISLPKPETEAPPVFNNFSSTSTPSTSSVGLVAIHKRSQFDNLGGAMKKKKITITRNNPSIPVSDTTTKEYIVMVRQALDASSFTSLFKALSDYKSDKNFDLLKNCLDDIFQNNNDTSHLLKGLLPYIKEEHKIQFKQVYNLT